MQQNQNQTVVKNPAISRKNVKHAAQTIAMLGVLTALGIICSMTFPYGLTIRFGDTVKVSLSFVVIAMAAKKYGVIASTAVAFLIDFLQAMISGLGFNPIISLSSTLVGVIFGLFFHNEKISFKRVLLAVTAETLICSVCLTTLALVMMGRPLVFTLVSRSFQIVLMFVIKLVVLYLMLVKTNILKRIHFI